MNSAWNSRAIALSGILFCILAAGCVAWSPSASQPDSPATAAGGSRILLPEPRYESNVSVEEALLRRRSIREYSLNPLELSDLSQLLWAGQGLSGAGLRTVPSAGALYPLEIYVACGNISGLTAGVYHYQVSSHALDLTSENDIRERLFQASLYQPAVRDAPAVLIIAADYSRTEGRYGERALRYVHMEAGHASENIYLQAYPLGIGTVSIGAFDDERIRLSLSLPKNLTPLYLMPVGKVTDQVLQCE